MEPTEDSGREESQELITWRPRHGWGSRLMAWVILVGVGLSIAGLIVAVLVMWVG